MKKGNDYVINGQKMWIINGLVVSWFFVLAYMDIEVGYCGMSGFVVLVDIFGIIVGKKE